MFSDTEHIGEPRLDYGIKECYINHDTLSIKMADLTQILTKCTHVISYCQSQSRNDILHDLPEILLPSPLGHCYNAITLPLGIMRYIIQTLRWFCLSADTNWKIPTDVLQLSLESWTDGSPWDLYSPDGGVNLSVWSRGSGHGQERRRTFLAREIGEMGILARVNIYIINLIMERLRTYHLSVWLWCCASQHGQSAILQLQSNSVNPT